MVEGGREQGREGAHSGQEVDSVRKVYPFPPSLPPSRSPLVPVKPLTEARVPREDSFFNTRKTTSTGRILPGQEGREGGREGGRGGRREGGIEGGREGGGEKGRV